MLDKFHDECGVVGIYGHPDAANLAYLGLYALQHRGQESAGIVASNNGKMHLEVGMGLVADVFSDARLKKLLGSISIGHNRYSTTGVSRVKNAQPCLIEYSGGIVAMGQGCAFFTLLTPVVEYLLCPMEILPRSFFRRASLKTSATKPIPTSRCILPLLEATIPALS
jgi:hypothetical protein